MRSSDSGSVDHRIVDWLLRDGPRIADSARFVDAFADRLVASGIEVHRVAIGVPVLHPQVFSFSVLWEAGKGAWERRNPANAVTFAGLQHSPVRTIYEGGATVRCDLTAPPTPGEYGIYADLRRDGYADYFAIAVPFSDGSNKVLAVATKRPGGFSDADIATFTALVPALAMNLEIQALRRTAQTLLDVYVGRQAGQRVLDGAIKRGMGESIRAVVWVCDLRGFTRLSEELPREALIGLLNAYFGAMCEAVEQHRGEVLKFIGDAMLAIFAIESDAAAAACAEALAAARAAIAATDALNAARAGTAEPPIRYGIALHVGDVIYGNIGGENRLDFTVIGPAVNLAVRIEALCHELARPILLSEAFAFAAGAAVEPVGRFALKGIAAPETVFAPS